MKEEAHTNACVEIYFCCVKKDKIKVYKYICTNIH